MNIAFTGHRDRAVASVELQRIAAEHPDAVWIHGGATGFDTQVGTYALQHGIQQIVIRPDYKALGRAAPFVRNRQIIDMADLVYACYDGRQTGGTLYTLRYAERQGKPTQILRPIEHQEIG
jgi:hypothetical protein